MLQRPSRRKVVIFRCELLAPSETFIASQAGALTNFKPCYAGVQRLPESLPIPGAPIVLMKSGSLAERVRRRIFLHTGWAPTFYSQLRREQAALIHAHFGLDGAVALPIQHDLRIPLIVTLHGYDVTLSDRHLTTGTAGRLYLRRRQKLWNTVARFICVSEFIRRQALKAGFPESKLQVHYIGIDPTVFVSDSRLRQPGLVLFVGRLVEKKGCRYLLEAMATVQQECREAKLVIIGDGPERASLEASAKEKAIPCQFIGRQPAQVVRDWLGRSQVFCVPSVTAESGDSEGMPMVFAEAQSMGVPVVSSAHAGIPEIVRNGETGLLAPERDHGKLAEHLIRFLTDSAFWRACSERGIALVKERFNLHLQTRKLEEIYSQAIGEDSGKRETVVAGFQGAPKNRVYE